MLVSSPEAGSNTTHIGPGSPVSSVMAVPTTSELQNEEAKINSQGGRHNSSSWGESSRENPWSARKGSAEPAGGTTVMDSSKARMEAERLAIEVWA